MNDERRDTDRELDVEAVRDPPTMARVRLDAVVDVEGCTFVVEERGRAPYPSELDKLEGLRARLAEVGTPLFVVPFVSDAVGDSLRRRGGRGLMTPGTSTFAPLGWCCGSGPRTPHRL